MDLKFHYGTVTEALEKLRAEGFTNDFTLEGNQFVCAEGKFNVDDMEIADAYRYEGDSDPGDEAVVYALISGSGVKGVLVMGYGMSADNAALDALNNLKIKKTQL